MAPPSCLVRRTICAAFLALAGSVLCAAQRLTGVVTDPQGKAVAATKISLVCGTKSFSALTDQNGSFTFSFTGPINHCTLDALHAGFARYHIFIRQSPARLAIRLSLAVLPQKLNVTPTEDTPVGAALDGASLSADELKKISNTPADLVAYSEQVAGTPPRPSHIYVDGLPSDVLPPTATIAAIVVNTDPFSAEYADGDENHVEIATGRQDRNLHFNVGGASLGLGGQNALASGMHSSSNWATPSITGPIPTLPLTFSFQMRAGSESSQQLIQSAIPNINNGQPVASIAAEGSKSMASLFDLYYSPTAATTAGVEYSDSKVSGSNSGIGGLTQIESAAGTRANSRQFRTFWRTTADHWATHSGFVFGSKETQEHANSTTQGLDVPGFFESGGAPVSNSDTADTQWTFKTVVESRAQKRLWSWGVTASGGSDSEFELANANGQLEFQNVADYTSSLSGPSTGVLIQAQGSGQAKYSSVALAPFLQGELWRAKNVFVTGGLRGDYQSGSTPMLSPRLSVIASFHQFILRSGAGVFVHPWANSTLAHILLGDGATLREFIFEPSSTAIGVPLVARIGPDFVRPRDIMLKNSIERTMGGFTAGLEYTWVDGTHLLGSRRITTAAGWTDLLESNRNLRSHDLHVRILRHWKKQSLVAHYHWINSYDDTDGPLSFPEFQDNVGADWARSAGIPAHSASLVGNANLPRQISLTVIGSWHGSSPYNVITGRDAAGNALFNDRGGRVRNSGNGPDYRSLSMYGYRHFSLGKSPAERGKPLGFDAGVQADNVFGNRNYLTYGSVVGSPFFGKPLAALPGRSLRIWFGFGE